MAEKENITSPSMGSNDLGTQTNDEASTGVSAGSDTQLHLAAAGGKKRKENKDVNDDERVIKNRNGESEFLRSDQTDE